MGSLKNGLFGGFNGRVGNIVGYELNGKNVIRTIGHSTKPLSPARKINCDRMKIVNKFLRPIDQFIRLGFRLKVVGTDRNYYNEAVSYNKKHAVSAEYPNAQLDYPKAMVSMGSLLKAESPQIQLIETEIEFTWEVPADLPWKNRNDRAMILLYWPDQGQSTSCLSGSQRHEGKQRIQIDPNLVHERVEAYISFINDDATEVSDSVYAGSIHQKELKEAAIVDHLSTNTSANRIVKKQAVAKINQVSKAKTTIKNQGHSRLNAKLKSQLQSAPKVKIPDK